MCDVIAHDAPLGDLRVLDDIACSGTVRPCRHDMVTTRGEHVAHRCVSDHQQRCADEVSKRRDSGKRSRRERMKTARANDGRGESCRHRTLTAIREHFESQGLYVFEDPKDGRLAALVDGDQVFGLTRTLGEGFKRAVTLAVAKALNC